MRRHSYLAATSLLMIAGALTMVGCGESGDAGNGDIIVGSCNTKATGICIDYGADYKTLTLDRLCKSQKGEYSAGACPVEERSGSCRVKGKKSDTIYRYYPSFPGYGTALGDGVAAVVEEQCVKTIKGKWTTG